MATQSASQKHIESSQIETMLSPPSWLVINVTHSFVIKNISIFTQYRFDMLNISTKKTYFENMQNNDIV